MGIPKRGEVWWVNLSPTKGNEQKGWRPCLVLSVDEHNTVTRDPLNTIFVVPMTTTIREDVPWHVPFRAEELGVDKNGALLCDQTRPVALERFERKGGEVQEDSRVMSLVLDKIMVLLGYPQEIAP